MKTHKLLAIFLALSSTQAFADDYQAYVPERLTQTAIENRSSLEFEFSTQISTPGQNSPLATLPSSVAVAPMQATLGQAPKFYLVKRKKGADLSTPLESQAPVYHLVKRKKND